MSDCCNDFVSTVTTADRLPNPIWIAHDDCGYPATYKGVVGTQYNKFMPVKFGATPGTVEPALDGVDAIGISMDTKLASATDANLHIVQFASTMAWADIAAAVGASPTDAAAYWAMLQNLHGVVKTITF